jgi:hypothetical protein
MTSAVIINAGLTSLHGTLERAHPPEEVVDERSLRPS